jgi:hypothetical protein
LTYRSKDHISSSCSLPDWSSFRAKRWLPDTKVLDLIERIYAAAEDPRVWPVFLESLSETVKATTTALAPEDYPVGHASMAAGANSATKITTTVPAGATTGIITVTTPAGSGVSATNFAVP